MLQNGYLVTRAEMDSYAVKKPLYAAGSIASNKCLTRQQIEANYYAACSAGVLTSMPIYEEISLYIPHVSFNFYAYSGITCKAQIYGQTEGTLSNEITGITTDQYACHDFSSYLITEGNTYELSITATAGTFNWSMHFSESVNINILSWSQLDDTHLRVYFQIDTSMSDSWFVNRPFVIRLIRGA